MKSHLIRKTKNQIFRYSLLSKFIFFFCIFKFCHLSCDPNLPFRKNGECAESCTTEEINDGQCIIEDEILKTQWINNIRYLSEPDFLYFNFIKTKNEDLIVLMSKYPDSNDRVFFGLTKEGRGCFKKNNQETEIDSMTVGNPNTVVYRYESESLIVKLKSTTSTKEYLMEFGRTPQFLQIYDIDRKTAIYQDISKVFYELSGIQQLVGAKLKLTSSSENYYLIGLVWVKYINYVGYYTISLIKFKIESISTQIKVTYSKKELSSSPSQAISCYETSSLYIICFYKNQNKEYTMGVFSSSLELKLPHKISNGNDNEEIFFKCAHFFGDIGAFVYYSNTNPPYAILELKQYSSNQITNYYNPINFNGYSFYYNIALNDIIKEFDKKIYYAAVSLDKYELFIITIYNYDQKKIIQRIYKTKGFLHNKHNFYNMIRIDFYNNYLIFGSNGSKEGNGYSSSLTIFSYPNSIDVNKDITELLFNDNEIKIKNITLEIKNLCKIDNNIFGHILTGIKIIEIYKTTNEYFSLFNGTQIMKDMFIDIDETLKVEIPKTENIYTSFSYGMKFFCQAKEPEYEEYNKYPIYIYDSGTGTSKKEDFFFESNRKTYSGRYSFYYVILNKELTEEGCEKGCELCYNNNKNKCLTCILNDFEPLEGNKKCKEVIPTTIIETTILQSPTTIPVIITTIPELIQTTIPAIITTIPELIQTTIPAIITTIPELIQTTIPIIDTTIPELIQTTIPIIDTTIPKIVQITIQDKIKSTIPEIIQTTSILEKIENNILTVFETNIPSLSERSNCSAKSIIKGDCIGELSDDMGEDIFLYIKKELINSNLKEDNLIITTPNIGFQLTTEDYQKNNNLNLSIVDLGECSNILKEKYNISKEYGLIIFKIDIKNPNNTLTYVQYEVYHPETFIQLDLDVCQNLMINISIPAKLDSETILLYNSLESQGYNLFNSNDKFYNDICAQYSTVNNTDVLLIDRKNDIYNKYANITICQENCNLQSYNDNSKMVSCSCNIQSNDTEIDLNILQHFNFNYVKLAFMNYLNNSNFRVLKCYEIAIDLKTIFENIGRIIMTSIFLVFIILFIIFLIKGNKQISIYLNQIIKGKLIKKKEKNKIKKKNYKGTNKKKLKGFKKKKKSNKVNDIKKKQNIKKIKSKKIISNPNKKKTIIKDKSNNIKIYKLNKEKKITKNIKSKKSSLYNSKFKNKNFCLINSEERLFKNRTKNNKNNIFIYNVINNFSHKNESLVKEKIVKNTTNTLNDQELNTLTYDQALISDKRIYFQYYWSLLKKKHLIIFTFLPNNDYNLPYIKIILFLLTFSLYFSINGFFFSDETMHKIYKNNGIVNYLNQLASILYSSVIPSVINTILKLLSLSEKDILNLKQLKEKEQVKEMAAKKGKYLKIKFFIFFFICFLLLFFFWYFISCFCGVYKNTQMILIIDTLISFGISMLYPFGLNLLPGMFRIPALRAKNKDKICLYKFSFIISLI